MTSKTIPIEKPDAPAGSPEASGAWRPSSKALTLARRELAGYFLSPLAYVIGALFVAGTGLFFFYDIFVPGSEATLRVLFEKMAQLMVVAAPLLTMRLVSEELRSGTIETLLTAPVTETDVILGKFLGVMGFYVALLACTGVFLGLMAAYGQPDPGVAATGYLGLILLGAAYLSVGLLASTITPYQILAAVVGAVILALFTFVMPFVVAYAGEPWNRLAMYVNTLTYFKDFSRGILDTRGVVFFVSATVFFLFLSVKTLESRRWR